MNNKAFWKNKRVFLTGHTGFKGSWLSLWLSQLGAKVYGYSLTPATRPNLFDLANVENHIESSIIADIRDVDSLEKALLDSAAEIVIHMAAQPLVRYSYTNPVETYETNVMGTINLFEAVRNTETVKVILNVTTDKCYENKEWVWPYRENEAMGGADPYSSSKACSELLTASYRKSFFKYKGILVASARAGNVIGGGDWSNERLIPDFLNSIDRGCELLIRSPNAIRPWQHVLEPLSGYLNLTMKLYQGHSELEGGWNFGPNENDAKPVKWIVEYLCDKSNNATWRIDANHQPYEANTLKLDISKAMQHLHWKPRWRLEYALDMILEWHNAWSSGADVCEICLDQIAAYDLC